VKNIFILLFHDFAFAIKSKSIYLVFFIPLFVFASEHLLDKSKTEADKFKIALVSSDIYSAPINKALRKAEEMVEFIKVGSEDEGRSFLKEHAVQGVVAAERPRSNRLSLTVLRKDSVETLAIVQLFSVLQDAQEKRDANWISQITSLREGSVQSLTLSTWILMLVLLVGFVILPAQVAEEKEKKLILALLQTPIVESQWLISKILFGVGLTLSSVLLLALLSRFNPQNQLATVVFIALGGYCFTASGILLGLLCRHQASARTLGFIFYLPPLLPSALGDFSKKLTSVAPFLPSYQFFSPLHELLFDRVNSSALFFSTTYLLALGSGLLGLSYLLLKKRWLMNT
jgi:ABC-2 type transport system permease protein